MQVSEIYTFLLILLEYECKNRYNSGGRIVDKDSFENTIKQILSSDEILNIIEMLYAKAAMISSEQSKSRESEVMV